VKAYKCNCGSEAIHIERLEWLSETGERYTNDEYQISIWHQGGNKYTLKEKLRHCWRVLKTGKPYPDQVCLDLADARELVRDLAEMVQISSDNQIDSTEAA